MTHGTPRQGAPPSPLLFEHQLPLTHGAPRQGREPLFGRAGPGRHRGAADAIGADAEGAETSAEQVLGAEGEILEEIEFPPDPVEDPPDPVEEIERELAEILAGDVGTKGGEKIERELRETLAGDVGTEGGGKGNCFEMGDAS